MHPTPLLPPVREKTATWGVVSVLIRTSFSGAVMPMKCSQAADDETLMSKRSRTADKSPRLGVGVFPRISPLPIDHPSLLAVISGCPAGRAAGCQASVALLCPGGG